MSEPRAADAFIRKMDAAFNLLTRLCFLIAGISIVVMTVIFAWLVFGRYVLNDTPTWVEQASLLLVMTIAFLGAAAGVNQDTHLSVVVFRNMVPKSVRTVFAAVTDIIMAVFGVMMFWYGTELTLFKWNSQIPLIHLPEGMRSLPLTVCGILVFLFSAGHLIRLFLGRDKREDNIE